MSNLPTALLDFVTLCQSHYGSEAADSSDDSAYVSVDGRVIQVNLDPVAGRAVFWTELARPDHSDSHALEEAALLFSSHELLDHGFVVTVNAAADLILIGRSIEQDVLQQYAGLKFLGTITEAASRAQTALEAAIPQSNGRPSDHDQSMIRM